MSSLARSLQPVRLAARSLAAPAAIAVRGYAAPARPEPKATPTNLPGSNLPGASKYSPLTVSLVTNLAKLFGYNSKTSTAIRTASDYYDRCAERGEIEAPFFYEECALPPSFQTWFSITTLHIWLLSVRFRSLPPPLGQSYLQELINHFFIDVELRIRGPYGVTQGRLIKGHMKDMLEQFHGSCAAYDEALLGGDDVLAAAMWRNIFGGGWGGVGGVKGKGSPKVGEIPKYGPNPNPLAVETDPKKLKVAEKAAKKAAKGPIYTTDQPNVDPLRAAVQPRYPEEPDLEFAISLEKLVLFVRHEVQRLERLDSDNVTLGRPMKGPTAIIDFTKINSIPIPR